MSRNICMVGICGAGMAPLAIFLSEMGNVVYGWDDHVNFEIKDLLTAHEVSFLPEKTLPENCDLVVRSSAIDEEADKICVEAHKRNTRIIRRGEFLAEICSGKKLIAVMGSHGKTTVSGTCAEILKENNVACSYIIGGFFKKNQLPPSSYDKSSEWVIAEIDESDGTMKDFLPECTIALNYDDDHICNYGSKDNFIKAFDDLFAKTRSKIFVPESDSIFNNLASKYPHKYVKIAGLPRDDFSKINTSIASFCLEDIFGKKLKIPGSFVGIQRRSDIMLKTDKVIILNDYAHHPTEIKKLLQYTKIHYKEYELNIVFQPHRLSRTKQYFKEFAEILSEFDHPSVVELYSAFESGMEGVTSSLIFDNIINENKNYIPLNEFSRSMSALYEKMLNRKKQQLLMFVGAGNILSHAKKFVQELAFNEAKNHLSKANVGYTESADVTNCFSIRIPTKARIFVEPGSLNDLQITIEACRNFGLRYIIIGAGTKFLPPDEMINAILIRLKAKCWQEITWIDDDIIKCGAGSYIRDFASAVRERLFFGAEKLNYIPGRLGGAIRMNAGAHGQTISDHLIAIEAIDLAGNIIVLKKSDIKFAYRRSSLEEGFIVLSATFKFEEQKSAEYFQSSAKELLEIRKQTQPRGLNFGSTFKNTDTLSAGFLIDSAGIKGRRIGGASISEKHANFIVNEGNASSRDVEKLIDIMRFEVRSKFEKFLHLEVKVLRA